MKSMRPELVSKFAEACGRTLKGQPRHKKGTCATIDAHHLVCGSCGVKCVDGEQGKWFKEFPLCKMPSFMHLTTFQEATWRSEKRSPLIVPTDSQGGTRQVDISLIRSVFESTSLGICFHLHPEFVHKDTNGRDCTFLCQSCHAHMPARAKSRPASSVQLDDDTIAAHGTVETVPMVDFPPDKLEGATDLFPQATLGWDHNARAPPFSIASGLDFGDFRRLGLPQLTMVERLIISKVRHFHNVMKVQSNHSCSHRSDGTMNKIKAHSIAAFTVYGINNGVKQGN